MKLPKFDVIVTWPRNADYPLWRKFIRDNRAGFNNVFVVFMQPNQGYNYMPFVVESMTKDDVTSILSPHLKSGEDWRDAAVNEALKHSNSEWVWFTEQDFYLREGFWEDVAKGIEQGMDVIGVMDGDRLHPCSLIIKREVLEKTGKNFGIQAGFSDHFGMIQKQLSELNVKTGIITEDKYKHYAGMSHNWRLVSDGQNPNYKPTEFLGYLRGCLEAGIELEQNWQSCAEKAINAQLPQVTTSPLPR